MHTKGDVHVLVVLQLLAPPQALLQSMAIYINTSSCHIVVAASGCASGVEVAVQIKTHRENYANLICSTHTWHIRSTLSVAFASVRVALANGVDLVGQHATQIECAAN
jgi:secreted trypsin-like serine protease